LPSPCKRKKPLVPIVVCDGRSGFVVSGKVRQFVILPERLPVGVSLSARELRIEVEDDGRPFNPLEHPAPDLSNLVDARPVGGLGIHMMRNSLDGLEYRRQHGKNIMVMIKRI